MRLSSDAESVQAVCFKLLCRVQCVPSHSLFLSLYLVCISHIGMCCISVGHARGRWGCAEFVDNDAHRIVGHFGSHLAYILRYLELLGSRHAESLDLFSPASHLFLASHKPSATGSARCAVGRTIPSGIDSGLRLRCAKWLGSSRLAADILIHVIRTL